MYYYFSKILFPFNNVSHILEIRSTVLAQALLSVTVRYLFGVPKSGASPYGGTLPWKPGEAGAAKNRRVPSASPRARHRQSL